jgi:hypothetical protein
MASSSSTNPNRDYLTSLPNEILIKVISEIPILCYLDIAHTSRHLRSVLKANAARICNLRISSRYWFAAQYFQTEIKSGWLLPKHDVNIHIDLQERPGGMALEMQYLCGELWNEKCSIHKKRQNRNDVKIRDVLGQLFPDDFWVCDWEGLIHIKISGPGPQFLLLLEYDLLDICDGGGDANCAKSDKECKREHVHCSCAAHCKRQPDDLDSVGALGDDSYGLARFLDEDNECHFPLKVGSGSAGLPHSYVPESLIWHYGVDNLVSTWNENR